MNPLQSFGSCLLYHRPHNFVPIQILYCSEQTIFHHFLWQCWFPYHFCEFVVNQNWSRSMKACLNCLFLSKQSWLECVQLFNLCSFHYDHGEGWIVHLSWLIKLVSSQRSTSKSKSMQQRWELWDLDRHCWWWWKNRESGRKIKWRACVGGEERWWWEKET